MHFSPFRSSLRRRRRLLIAPRYQLLPVIVTAMVLLLWPWDETGLVLHGETDGIVLAVALVVVVLAGLVGGPWLIGRPLRRGADR